MMTVAETEFMRRASEKGRSASFCVPGNLPITLSSAYSSSDLSEKNGTIIINNLLDITNSSNQSACTKITLQVAPKPRRSQSCRVSGSRPPRVQRRQITGNGSGRGSTQGSGDGSSAGIDGRSESSLVEHCCINTLEENFDNKLQTEFLQNVGSCGRLITLSPSLTEIVDGSPTLKRSASARRPKPHVSPNNSPISARGLRTTGTSSMKLRSASRKSMSNSIKRPSPAYLNIHTTNSAETLDPDAYLLRNFSTSNKGIINRGDSFRRRRSRSNSVQPSNDNAQGSLVPISLGEASPLSNSCDVSPSKESTVGDIEPDSFRMVILGAPGVGKTALLNQFKTSECINAYDFSAADISNQPVSIVLNNVESEVLFMKTATQKELQDEIQRQPSAHGWLVMYSITDKSSFQKASEELTKLQTAGLLKGRAVILAGNKCELVRTRSVQTDDGKDLACNFGAKFMEISVGMNHKCDDLLVGILNQLRLKEEATSSKDSEAKSPWKRKSIVRASMKAKKLVNRIIGKSDSKHKTCEDFLV